MTTATAARPVPGTVEERTAAPTAAAPVVAGRRLHGLIPYAVESRDLGGFREIIEPGALTGADLSDLIATREHDRSKLLGRHPTTLTAEDRADGFAWSVELPQSPVGEDVRVAIERGDLRSTSWRMVVGRDRWEGDVRHVEQISELRDVTVTASPAYGGSTSPGWSARIRPRCPGSSTGWWSAAP
jgi:HK97 family phage prohead protease